jgi:hypothetical protein
LGGRMQRGPALIWFLAVLLVLAACQDKPSKTQASEGPAATSAAGVPGGTTADPTLQRDVSNMVLLMDSALDKTCKDHRIVDTAVTETLPNGHTGAELWTVDRCGKKIRYPISYMPDGHGGTFFAVESPE